MANADISVVGPAEVELMVSLYNRIAVPPVNKAFFERRSRGRYNVVTMVAELDKETVGFVQGYELRPTTFYIWLVGVLPEARRLGVGSQLLSAQEGWAAEHHYENIRLECHNRHKPLIHAALAHGFDIVGIRYDHDRADNLVVLEKYLEANE